MHSTTLSEDSRSQHDKPQRRRRKMPSTTTTTLTVSGLFQKLAPHAPASLAGAPAAAPRGLVRLRLLQLLPLRAHLRLQLPDLPVLHPSSSRWNGCWVYLGFG